MKFLCYEDNGRHFGKYLKEIYSTRKRAGNEVVRWCTECGGVVVDLDSSNGKLERVIRDMEFPKAVTVNLPIE